MRALNIILIFCLKGGLMTLFTSLCRMPLISFLNSSIDRGSVLIWSSDYSWRLEYHLISMHPNSSSTLVANDLQIPNLLKIVTTCIAACRDGKASENDRAIFAQLDSKQLEQIELVIRTHVVAGLLYDVSKYFPLSERFLNQLEKIQNIDLAQHLRQKSAFVAVQKLLHNKVEIINVKGIELHERFYADSYVRSSTDIDILVADESYAVFADCLRRAGYKKQDRFNDRRDRLVGRWAQEAIVWNNPAVGIQLDVHILSSRRFKKLYRQSQKFTMQVPYHDVFYRALRPDALVEYLCNHAAKHGWCRIQWCVDIDRILRKVSHDEKSEILKRAIQARGNLNMIVGLFLTEKLLRSNVFNQQLPSSYVRKVQRLIDLVLRNSLGVEQSRFAGWVLLR